MCYAVVSPTQSNRPHIPCWLLFNSIAQPWAYHSSLRVAKLTDEAKAYSISVGHEVTQTTATISIHYTISWSIICSKVAHWTPLIFVVNVFERHCETVHTLQRSNTARSIVAQRTRYPSSWESPTSSLPAQTAACDTCPVGNTSWIKNCRRGITRQILKSRDIMSSVLDLYLTTISMRDTITKHVFKVITASLTEPQKCSVLDFMKSPISTILRSNRMSCYFGSEAFDTLSVEQSTRE